MAGSDPKWGHPTFATSGEGLCVVLVIRLSTNKRKAFISRYPFLLGLIQVAEYDTSQTTKIVAAMHKFVACTSTMMSANTGFEEWGNARWYEYGIALQWCAI